MDQYLSSDNLAQNHNWESYSLFYVMKALVIVNFILY